jgi:16S rRNA (guanine966-N2)-methyltransferase
VKVLSGNLGGRVFDQPKTTAVRPLSDKVRAAIFDIVGSPEGFVVLDAYAGSGAAGFEALSRGALMVDAVEANSRVARVIASSAKKLELDWGYVLHLVTIETWLASPSQQPPQSRYNLIIVDPPYARIDIDILARIGQYLHANGVMCISHSSKLELTMLESLELVRRKDYGDTSLSFYKKKIQV